MRIAEWLLARWLLVPLLVLMALALPLVLAGELAATARREDLARAETQAAVGDARRGAALINERIAGIRDDLQAVSLQSVSGRSNPLLAAVDSAQPEQIQSQLESLKLVLDPSVRTLRLFDPAGKLLFQEPPVRVELVPSAADDPAFTIGVGTAVAMSEPYLCTGCSAGTGSGAGSAGPGSGTAQMYIAVTTTLRVHVNEPQAVPATVAARIEIGKLAALIEMPVLLDSLAALRESYVEAYVTDRRGRLLVRASQLFAAGDDRLKDLSAEPIIARAGGAPIADVTRDPVTGSTSLISSAAIRELSANLFLVGPRASAVADLDAALTSDRLARSSLAAVLVIGSALLALAGNRTKRARDQQAVIATENVRLFNETKESLERERATAQVLQVISRSAFDIQPVLESVTTTAATLCRADAAWMRRIEDGRWTGDPKVQYGAQQFRGWMAAYGRTAEFAALLSEQWKGWTRTPPPSSVIGRAAAERRTIHIPDFNEHSDLEGSDMVIALGARAVLAVPLLRQEEAVGSLVLVRLRAEPFDSREIELVETFAGQAAIAIENVRLFNEIQDKSRELEVASRHKSEFLANMSHELRTPLNAIIGFSEVLLQGMFGEVNAKQREYLDDVLSSGRHLLSLINDMLDLAKIEAGRVELELAEFSLPAALENGLTMVRERAARQNIRLELDVKKVDRIVADERKVKQVVFNLLYNAVKFTPDGGRVAVQAESHNGEVRVAVRDTGIGIDPADRERIFEEFQQAGRDPDRSREGTGLGLALSKRYVELHGGRIWVDSEPGQGSTFTFALPLLTQEEVAK